MKERRLAPPEGTASTHFLFGAMLRGDLLEGRPSPEGTLWWLSTWERVGTVGIPNRFSQHRQEPLEKHNSSPTTASFVRESATTAENGRKAVRRAAPRQKLVTVPAVDNSAAAAVHKTTAATAMETGSTSRSLSTPDLSIWWIRSRFVSLVFFFGREGLQM